MFDGLFIKFSGEVVDQLHLAQQQIVFFHNLIVALGFLDRTLRVHRQKLGRMWVRIIKRLVICSFDRLQPFLMQFMLLTKNR